MKISYRLLIIIAVFVTCLITANIIVVKFVNFGPVSLPASVIVFPLSYIFGDILTEVYGYRWARRVIWLGFACNFIFVAFVFLGQVLPAASFWNLQPAYQSILGYTPRLLLGSFCGYLVGEFANSFIMARMKILTRGRFLWTRTIGSTIVGEGLDTAVFQIVAFAGTSFFNPMFILYHWGAKTLIETLATPATYAVVGFLKRRENQDAYDYRTNFNPFTI
jgi:uncharacterized integral membrane protein (TIGR00697 family)